MSKFNIEFTKTYASIRTAEIAVKNTIGERLMNELRWTIIPIEILTVNGCDFRYGVVFFGKEAVEEGIHFDFNVIA